MTHATDVHQHVWPEELVDRLRARTRPPYLRDWVLHTDGEPPYDVDPSAHGSVRAPRRFTFWREAPLRAVLASAGWRVDHLGHRVGLREQPWLTVRASRRAD